MGKALLLLFILATPASARQIGVVAFGDSLTQGYGLIEQEGFVPQMREWLEGQGADVRLVNAGVSGDTTAGGAARIDWTLTEDIDAIIVALGGNDMLRGIDPSVSRANLEAILSSARANGVAVLLVGMEAPGNYGPAYKEAFDGMYPELAAEYGALHYENFLAALLEQDPSRFGELMQPDGIHPSGAGVALIVEDMGPHVIELLERVPE